jgi:transcriptional regulator with PAS, ATPase and Fis domain
MYASYLHLMQGKIQSLSESMSETIGLDVTVVDSTLRRIAGTGDFSAKIDDNSPYNSIFQQVLTSEQPVINHNKRDNPTCLHCMKYDTCVEKENISYPITVSDSCIGVVSVACFSEEQSKTMEQREQEAISLMRYMVSVIESEILSIEQHNKIISNHADVNEVINCIDKGIVIVDGDNQILHINSAAIGFLHLSFSKQTVLGASLESLITGIDFSVREGFEIATCWNVQEKKLRVIYKLNRLQINDQGMYKILTFETIDDIVHKASLYKDKQRINFSSIRGNSPIIQEAIRVAKIAAINDSTILLCGDSGTGKDLFARSIHQESYRRNGPFIAINCACMPEHLIEAELFGYRKGAFTGADPQGKTGKFEVANGGTIFLDEIAELPLHLQGKLLRVLQERQIQRIGCNETVTIDVRIIAASNKDLQHMVAQQVFREDLFYRLHVIPINLPSLRERGDDILILAEYILEQMCYRMNKRPMRIAREVIELFMRYSWPGNIREMENVIEYAVNFCTTSQLQIGHLPAYLSQKSSVSPLSLNEVPSEDDTIAQIPSYRDATQSYERALILSYLRQYGESTESKRRIAKELNMSLATLYRKLGTRYR